MFRRIAISLLIVLMAVAFTCTSVGAQARLEGTAGGVGGAWYSTLAGLAGLLNEKDSSIQINVSPGGGVANPATIGEGQFDIGWVYPTFAKMAYEGKDPYENEYTDLRMIATSFSLNYIELSKLADYKVSLLE